MQAILQIGNSKIQLNDETLVQLNKVLESIPVCSEVYKNDKYEYPANESKHLKFKPVFELKPEIYTVEKPN